MVKEQQEPNFRRLIRNIFIGVILFAVFFLTVYTIPAGYRGVVLTFGKPSEIVAEEGFHIKIPFAQTVKKMEVRTQKIEVKVDSATLDLQDVQTTIALNFHLAPDRVNKVYQGIGLYYKQRIIDPSIEESVKAVSATFTAEQLITKRPKVRDGMQEFITKKLEKYNIVVDDFNIVNFQFSEEFDKAIEAKVTAEQLKLKAEMDLERIKVEKEQKITQAQAEAEALRIQKKEITLNLIRLREIEVRRAAIEKWDGVLPKVTGGVVPFIGVGEIEEENL